MKSDDQAFLNLITNISNLHITIYLEILTMFIQIFPFKALENKFFLSIFCNLQSLILCKNYFLAS